MLPLDQGFTRCVLKIEWKTSGINRVCVRRAHFVQGSWKTQPPWHWQRLRPPRATVGVRRRVASLWQLALKHIYLGTVAYAGTEQQTHSDNSETGSLAYHQQGAGQSPNMCSECTDSAQPPRSHFQWSCLTLDPALTNPTGVLSLSPSVLLSVDKQQWGEGLDGIKNQHTASLSGD